MKPDKINILGIEYSIEYVDKPSDVDIAHKEVLWGQVDYWTRSIRVYDNGRAIEDIWQVLMHEILHCIGDALKLKLNEEEHHDELDVLALALTDMLFRNNLMNVEDKRKPKSAK